MSISYDCWVREVRALLGRDTPNRAFSRRVRQMDGYWVLPWGDPPPVFGGPPFPPFFVQLVASASHLSFASRRVSKNLFGQSMQGWLLKQKFLDTASIGSGGCTGRGQTDTVR